MLPLLLLTFWPGFADAAAVEGLRPSQEIRAGLRTLEPKLTSCARDNADLVVDVEILAAGFVDRTTILANDNFDAACVVDAIRSLTLSDRGKEPATHVVLRVASAAPSDLFPRAIATALGPVRDDFARCVARAHASGTVVLHFTARDDGSIADVDTKQGSLQSDAARACIATALASLRLDRAGRVSYALSFDTPPLVETKTASALDKPTLFDVLGCGSAFR